MNSFLLLLLIFGLNRYTQIESQRNSGLCSAYFFKSLAEKQFGRRVVCRYIIIQEHESSFLRFTAEKPQTLPSEASAPFFSLDDNVCKVYLSVIVAMERAFSDESSIITVEQIAVKPVCALEPELIPLSLSLPRERHSASPCTVILHRSGIAEEFLPEPQFIQ